MSQAIAAVLFDFDGVLVHSEPLHYQAFRDTVRDDGIDLTESDYYEQLIGFDDRGAFKKLYALQEKPLDPRGLLNLMARKGRIMQELIHRRQYSAMPGVEELVRGLWWHYPLAIVSGALREEIEAMLEGIALRDCFRVIVAAEDVEVGKPDPAGYLQAAEMLGRIGGKTLPPARCLVVEDSPAVIDNAKRVGFQTLGVASTHFAEKLSAADHVVKTLEREQVMKVYPRLRLYREPTP